MKTKTFDGMALDLLLAGDEAGLSALAKRASDFVEGRLECPECGDRGPHDDDGAVNDRCFCCRACGMQFQPIEPVE